ncbi:MAG TPA: GspE/PulE family protein [Phycisphaerae bacterium]|jgi:type II secretory ATPase GspE/PulE/Tfp pilus assembly ATPase PilB-like protein
MTATQTQIPSPAQEANSGNAGLVAITGETIEAMTEQILAHAARYNASDVFFGTNEQCVMVQIRHLGIVRPLTVLTAEQGRRVITLIKTRALLDLAERRRPQEGRWIYHHVNSQGADTIYDLRVSAIPTAFGEDLALRLLNRTSTLFTLDNLGMARDQRNILGGMLDSPSGLVLFTGPTGSGKTATLYTCLQRLNNGKRKMNTIEDPIEYALDGIRQSQVNPAIGLGFSELLRSVMRQSPDVIMIGEIRDQETATIAIRAANSGHLVLATIHAVAAAGAIQSMRALGVHPHFLATALRCIVAQRLVRTLCSSCKTSFDLADAPHTFDDVAGKLEPGEGKKLWAARGCKECLMTGYASRTGVFELMPISRAIRNLISENHTVREIRARAAEEKMLEFRDAALLRVAQGHTCTEEVFRAIPTEHLVADD